MNDDFTMEELLNGYDPNGAQERYDDKKSATSAKTTAGRFLGRPHQIHKKQDLKKLGPRHYEMIALHLRGNSLKSIAETVGITYTRTWQVINDPLSRQIIEEFYESHKVDLMGLFPVAVETVRKGLNSQDIKTSLLAVDRFIKLKESVDESKADPTQVNITIVNDARQKLVGAIKKKVLTLTENSDGTFVPDE